MSNLELKEIRKKLKLSQEKFGEKVGVSLRTVQNWESGVNEVPKMLEILINEFNKNKNTNSVHSNNEIADIEIDLRYTIEVQKDLIKSLKKELQEKPNEFKDNKNRATELIK